MFLNRSDAGKQLAAKLKKYQNTPSIILAVPRGGIPVAYEVAKELKLPVEVVLAKKLGHPMNKEYAIGAVGLTDRIVVPHDDVEEDYIEEETERIRKRLEIMRRQFIGDKHPADLKDKIAIVIDDGIATGTTLLATIKILRKQQPAKIVIAVPVVAQSVFERFTSEADEIVAVLVPQTLYGVGRFYEDFRQTSDEEVIDLLNSLNTENRE